MREGAEGDIGWIAIASIAMGPTVVCFLLASAASLLPHSDSAGTLLLFALAAVVIGPLVALPIALVKNRRFYAMSAAACIAALVGAIVANGLVFLVLFVCTVIVALKMSGDS